MHRMMALMACLVLAGGLGCGDDDTGSGGAGGGASSSTTGGGGGPGGRVGDILALTGDAVAGNMVFTTSCGNSSCHGADGTGSMANARDLTTFASTIDDAQLVGTILDGFSGDDGIMPGLANQLGDQEVADVVAYVRATFP